MAKTMLFFGMVLLLTAVFFNPSETKKAEASHILNCSMDLTALSSNSVRVDVQGTSPSNDHIAIRIDFGGGGGWQNTGGSSPGSVIGSASYVYSSSGVFTVRAQVYPTGYADPNDQPSECNLSRSFTSTLNTTGTIRVTSNISTCWSVSGPTANSGCGTSNGSGYTSNTGTYSISPQNQSGYTFSVSPSASQTLSAGGTINWTITYTAVSGAPGPFNIISVSCFNWPSPRVEVNWSESAGATGYSIYRRVNGGSYNFLTSSYRADGSGFDQVDSSVSSGNTYEYQVRATNSSGTPTNSSNTRSVLVTGPNCGEVVVGQFTLTVTKSGTGSGTVTSSPAGINCGASCAANFTSGSNVTLTASADAGSVFVGWSNGCSGTGGCTVAMSANRTRNAVFDSGPSCTGNNADFVTQSINGVTYNSETTISLQANTVYPVSITYNNPCGAVWLNGVGYALGSQFPQDNMNWGLNRVPITTNVFVGANYTFNFNITTPGPGTSTFFRWRMVRDGVGWFGALTPLITVNTPNVGAIIVNSNLAAGGWGIDGPSGPYSGSGLTATYSNATAGIYALVPTSVPGYNVSVSPGGCSTPPACGQQNLAPGGTITFTVTYSIQTGTAYASNDLGGMIWDIRDEATNTVRGSGVGTPVTAVTLPVLPSGQRYYFTAQDSPAHVERIRVNGTGPPQSNPHYFTVTDGGQITLLGQYSQPPPNAPSNITLQVSPCEQLRFSWTDNSNNETGFQLYWGNSAGTVTTPLATVGANVTTYTWTNPPLSPVWVGVAAYINYPPIVSSATVVSSSSYTPMACSPDMSQSQKELISVNGSTSFTNLGQNGDTLRFRIRVRNVGTDDVSIVRIRDILRPNMGLDGIAPQLVRPSGGWNVRVDKNGDGLFDNQPYETSVDMTGTAPDNLVINLAGPKCTEQNYSGCSAAIDPACRTTPVPACNSWEVTFDAVVQASLLPTAKTEAWNTAYIDYNYNGVPNQRFVQSERYILQSTRPRVPDFREIAP